LAFVKDTSTDAHTLGKIYFKCKKKHFLVKYACSSYTHLKKSLVPISSFQSLQITKLHAFSHSLRTKSMQFCNL